jgi:uncharacterized protein YlzI (FlbEa/FlbD family)
MLAAGVSLVVLHRLDGGEVSVNPAQITSMHEAMAPGHSKLFTPQSHCVIGLSDGKWLSVMERCETVRRLLVEDAVR